jgi:hypothetical protein
VKKNQVKLFFILLFTTAIIFSSSHFGAQAFENITKEDQKSNGKTDESINLKKTKKETLNNQNSKKIEEAIILNQSFIKMKDIPLDLQTFLANVSQIEISSESTLSMLDYLTEKKLNTLNSDTLSFIASGIYKTILPTNFSIMERNIGNQLPSNISLGYEAHLNVDSHEDFVFTNPNKAKYSIQLSMSDNILIITLKGVKFPYQYKITTNIQNFKPKTIIQYSPILASGKVRVTTHGKEGNLVKVYREIYQSDQLLKKELVADDYYPPVYRVEIHSLSVPNNEQSTETTNDTDPQGTVSTEKLPNTDQNATDVPDSTEMTEQNSSSSLINK